MRDYRKIRRLVPAVALAVAAAEARGQLVYEPFDYSTTNAAGNANITNSLADGGNSAAFGRTNGRQGIFWSRTGSAAADHTIDTASLTAPLNLPDSTGNKAAFTNTSNVDRIGFGQVITSGRVYYSLLLKFDTLPAATSRIMGFNTFALDAPNSATVFGSAVTTRAMSGGWQVGVAKNSATAQFDPRIWTTDDTLFVVGAYEINGTVASDDVSYLWVNPAADDYGADFGGEAGPDATAGRITDASAAADLHDAVGGGASPLRNASIASFLLRANGINSPWRVDELRIDTTWAGVTPRKDMQYTWNDAGGGAFGDPGKWNSFVGSSNPDVPGAVANFGSSITAAATITTGGQTVDTLHIDNANSLLIDGTGLTISTNASAGQLVSRQGSHSITAPLTLSDDLAVKVGSDGFGGNAAALTLGGSVTGAGRTIGKYGLGTLKLGASNIIDDLATLAVRVGTLDLNGNDETVGTVIVGAGHRNTGADLFTSPQLAGGSIIGSGTLSATTVQLENGSVSATLAGPGAVLKTSQGTAQLAGLSTYTGDTTIRAGTLLVGADAPSGAPGALGNSANAVIVSDSQTLSGTIDPGQAPKAGDPVSLLTSGAITIGRNVLVNPEGYPTLGGSSAHASTFSGSITLNRATNLAAAAGGTVHFTGGIADGTTPGSITKLGAGTVLLTGTNTYTGGTTVNAGALVAARPASLPGGAAIVNAGGTLGVSAGGAGQWSGGDIDLLLATTTWNAGSAFGINVDAANSFTYASDIAQPIGFAKLGPGTLILGGMNNHASTHIAGGALHVSSDANLGAVPGSPASNIILSGGGTLRFGAVFDPSNNRTITLASGQGVIDTNGHSVSTGATIEGAGTLVKAGGGQLNLGGSNTYFGGTIIRDGTLSIFNDANLGASGSAVTFDGGGLRVFSSFSMAARPVTVTAGGGAFATNTFNVDAGAVTGDGILSKSNSGQLAVTHLRTGGLNVVAGSVLVYPQPDPHDASSAAGVSRLGSVAVVAGKFDITNNKLITESSAGSASGGLYTGVQGLVQSAHNGGAWDGNGITTSQADALSGLTSIGVATGEQARGLSPADTDLFAGQTITGASTIAMYTYAGDANLDGQITGDDYSSIDFNIAVPNGEGWYNGDFNYDGIVSGDDYSVIDFNIVAQGAPFHVSAPAGDALAAVPEPASVSLVLLGLPMALAGRRRRQRRLASAIERRCKSPDGRAACKPDCLHAQCEEHLRRRFAAAGGGAADRDDRSGSVVDGELVWDPPCRREMVAQLELGLM